MAHKYPNILIHCVFSTKDAATSFPPKFCLSFGNTLQALGAITGYPFSLREGLQTIRICLSSCRRIWLSPRPSRS